MSLETEQVLKYLGFNPEEVPTEEAFKEAFEKQFVRGSTLTMDSPFVKPLLGRVFGEQENELKKLSSHLGLEIDFESPDFANNRKITDKAKYLASKLEEKKAAKIKELETKLSLNSDENLKALETKVEKYKKEKADVEGLLTHTKNEFETFKTTAINEVKGIKLNTYKTAAMSKIKFKDDISEFEKKGFEAIIADKYSLDLDESEGLIVRDKKGERLKSTTVNGEFKSFDEILTEEASAGKLFKVNNDGGKPAGAGAINLGAQTQQNQNGAQQQNITTRKVADRLE